MTKRQAHPDEETIRNIFAAARVDYVHINDGDHYRHNLTLPEGYTYVVPLRPDMSPIASAWEFYLDLTNFDYLK